MLSIKRSVNNFLVFRQYLVRLVGDNQLSPRNSVLWQHSWSKIDIAPISRADRIKSVQYLLCNRYGR